jgi:fructose-1,6-bisphosphatase/inositol monophosphatase family enzyme
MSAEDTTNFLEVACRAVKQAGEIALRLQAQPNLEVWRKEDGSPTTRADKDAERRIRQIIKEAYPDHRQRGEELGWYNKGSNNPCLWVYDPIDGTWAFINQESTSCIGLALLRDGVPILGTVYNPFTDELYQTGEGRNATLNGEALPRERPTSKPGVLGVVGYQLPKRPEGVVEAILRLWREKPVGKLVAPGGTPAYSLAQVAKGAYNSFILFKSSKPEPWDFAPAVLLVRSAGGSVTDLDGKAIDPLDFTGYLVASTYPDEHQRMLTLLAECGLGAV